MSDGVEKSVRSLLGPSQPGANEGNRFPVGKFVLAGLLGSLAVMVALSVFLKWFNQQLRNAHNAAIITHNLQVIDDQKRQWALDKGKSSNDTPSEVDLAPYFNSGEFPAQVIGETYNINPVGQHPSATIPSSLISNSGTIIKAGSTITIPDK